MSANTITFTVEKSDANTPWPGKIFSQDQIDNVVTPYMEFLSTLPGFQSRTYRYITSTVCETTFKFDTESNTISAIHQLTGTTKNPIVVLYDDTLKTIATQNNPDTKYTKSVSIS